MRRACLVAAPPGSGTRELAAACATRLHAHAPQSLWLVVVAGAADAACIIAIPPTPGSIRVCALVVQTTQVQDSDAETVAAMAAAAKGGSDVAVHGRWRELLGREALTARFYRELEAVVGEFASTARGRAPDDARRHLALLCASRLLFLSFVEAKGWLDGDREFLRHRFDETCRAAGAVHRRLLDPLFFGTLNTPVERRAAAARAFGRVPFLNGGLFTRTALEGRWRDTTFHDDAIGRMLSGLLGRFRVTAREDSASWSEAAIDPEMLGRAFESLMAADDRRKSGAFYTPRPILERVTAEGLDAWLEGHGIGAEARRALAGGALVPPKEREAVVTALGELRLLDPACGSGAFLVHALERVADMRRQAGDGRTVSAIRRDVLARTIFGVDINPVAVWLCELRLWLSVVIESQDRDGMDVAPLPNLDHNVRVGDALAGPGIDPAWHPREATGLGGMRARYVRATGARKRTLARALDSVERRVAVAALIREHGTLQAKRQQLLGALRGRDLFGRRITPAAAQRDELESLRASARVASRRLASLRAGGPLPFSFRTHFADVAARGGFDVIVGNPPWVRLHRISPDVRAALSRQYRSWRFASWEDGARDAGAGRGFGGQVDLSHLFVERATQLLRAAGAVSLLVPAKILTSVSAGGVRRVLGADVVLRAVEDWSESPAAFDAVVYPALLVATARAQRDALAPAGDTVRCAVHGRGTVFQWAAARRQLALDSSAGSPWILLPPEVRAAFDLLDARSVPLAQSPLGRPMLGVKTGCNDAFLVTPRPGWRSAPPRESWPVCAGVRADNVECGMLRPALRGEHVRAWSGHTAEAIVWTHGADGPVATLPPGAAAWLAPWRRQLDTRADARGGRYWEVFRTEAAGSARARVVWSDISREPRATILAPDDDTVPLNTCYVVAAPTIDDAFAFATLLNSAPVAGWLAALAEPARGGYRRYLGWTVARLPIPREWDRAVRILAPIGRAAMRDGPPDAHQVAAAVARAYGVRLPRLEPLITWSRR